MYLGIVKNMHTTKKIYSMGWLAWGGKETVAVVVICMLVKKRDST
jgi:hypothetical protein